MAFTIAAAAYSEIPFAIAFLVTQSLPIRLLFIAFEQPITLFAFLLSLSALNRTCKPPIAKSFRYG